MIPIALLKKLLLNKYSIIAILLLILAITYIQLAKYKQDVERQQMNVRAFADSTRIYKDKFDNMVSVNTQAELTVSELKKNQDSKIIELNRQLKAMGVKYRNLQSAGIGTSSFGLKDSIYIRDTVYIDTITLKYRQSKIGVWSDRWMTIVFEFKRDSIVQFQVNRTDTCIIAWELEKVGKWTFKNLFFWRDTDVKIKAKTNCPYNKFQINTYKINE